MNIAYMYRLYPTQKQKELFIKTFGCCRKVWNLMLEEHENRYKNNDKKAVTPAFFKSKYPYLCEVDSSALANVQRNLENEFTQFFHKKKKYPKHKSKKYTRKSYTTSCTNTNIKLLPQINRIQLPKAGKVKAVLHRLPKNEWII